MKFEEYEIIAITPEISDVFLIRLKPKGSKTVPKFKPGQFYHLKNPTYQKPHETRQFSMITTPKTKDFIEFCIKIYGPWTKALFEKKPGESIWLFGPMGAFTFRKTKSEVVFLAGGVGITPILSIIQSLSENIPTSQVTLIYANKSDQHILKKTHIENLFRTKPTWKLIFLVSQIDTLSKVERHGRITNDLLKQEVNLKKTPIFFICGSKRFTQNIMVLLQNLTVGDTHIKQEIFLPPYPNKKT